MKKTALDLVAMAEAGERTYHDTDSPYALPNDASEHERLELQTVAINRMLHDKPIRAPLTNPRRILEVGCGTGAMTAWLAGQYPSTADVIGVDLSPVASRIPPTRATFLQGDFRQMSTVEFPQLKPGSFDYIFSRMLVFGINDWPSYVAQIKDLLKPDGWIELQDLDFHFLDQNEQSICESWKWLQQQKTAWAARGLDIEVGSKLGRYLFEAGFEDIHVEKFPWVWGRWKNHPETRMIGEYSPKYLTPVNLGAYKKVLGPQKSPEELAADEAEMKETLGNAKEGTHQVFHVVWGRKP